MSTLAEQYAIMSDDLNTPLAAPGNRAPLLFASKGGSIVTYAAYTLIAGGLGFLAWIILLASPLGGQPYAIIALSDPAVGMPSQGIAPLNMRQSIAPGEEQPGQTEIASTNQSSSRSDGTSEIRNNGVTIIHRPNSGGSIRLGPTSDPALIEDGADGPLPRVAEDGRRPSHVYARPAVSPESQNPDQPRIAILVSGLGISTSGTLDAINNLPGEMSLGFAPYGTDLQNWVGRARRAGHEVLMQIPMEPFDYPDNDPGPHTLRVDGDSQSNLDRLHWLLSRFTGYVGVTNYMGARFTASNDALTPILQEISDRGLMYLDDHSSPRSRHNEIASRVALQTGSADVIIDAISDQSHIDAALIRLENLALRHGLVIGYASALPVSIARLSEWAKQLQDKGITLIPVSAALIQNAQS
ncbi:MAG: divergent polysaccharide deacetylase family protein [Rhizobiales bacterium]|nr:divergent polysaccharide deacetylase family protein [Hyphomicrobiales bacterium]